MIYTDTDSLVLGFHMQPENVSQLCRKMQGDQPMFDFSNLPENDPAFTKEYCAHLGFLKDEKPGKIIMDAYFPMPKTYMIKCLGDEYTVHAKSIPTGSAQELTEEQFQAQMPITQNFQQLRGKNLRMFTLEVEKIGISFVDLKSYWINGVAHPYHS